MRPIAALDIDGTVADARHRLHWLAGQPTHADWVEFFAAAAEDTLLDVSAKLAHRLAEDHEIVWLTGRPERIRDLTTRWLTEHGLPDGELLMHPSDDRRPARQLKLEHLDRLTATGRHIAVIVDDDPKVTDLLSQRGCPVQLANWLP